MRNSNQNKGKQTTRNTKYACTGDRRPNRWVKTIQTNKGIGERVKTQRPKKQLNSQNDTFLTNRKNNSTNTKVRKKKILKAKTGLVSLNWRIIK